MSSEQSQGTGPKLPGSGTSNAGAQGGQKTDMAMLMHISLGSRGSTCQLCCTLSASFALPRFRLLHVLEAAPPFLSVLDQETPTPLALL